MRSGILENVNDHAGMFASICHSVCLVVWKSLYIHTNEIRVFLVEIDPFLPTSDRLGGPYRCGH